jgi:hypothetical protein
VEKRGPERECENGKERDWDANIVLCRAWVVVVKHEEGWRTQERWEKETKWKKEKRKFNKHVRMGAPTRKTVPFRAWPQRDPIASIIRLKEIDPDFDIDPDAV